MNINKNDDVVLTSRVRLARNIALYPFPNKISETSANQLIEEIKDAILGASSKLADHFEFIDLRQLSFNDKMVLMESHLISQDLLKKQDPCSVLVYKDLGISIMVNEEDHLRIQCVTCGMDIKGAYELASRIDDLLEEKLKYAYNEKYGYLTACPTNVGTGLRASYMLHLPALEAYGQLQIILQAIGKFGITVRGMYGEGTDAYGSIFQISNQLTLGQSEADIIHNLNNITDQIVSHERNIRKKMMEEDEMQLKDKIYRSYGILSQARIMKSKEAMEYLSNIRVGIELGILEGLKSKLDIYDLMTKIQPASLQKIAGKELNSNEREIHRATFIREKLTKLT